MAHPKICRTLSATSVESPLESPYADKKPPGQDIARNSFLTRANSRSADCIELFHRHSPEDNSKRPGPDARKFNNDASSADRPSCTPDISKQLHEASTEKSTSTSCLPTLAANGFGQIGPKRSVTPMKDAPGNGSAWLDTRHQAFPRHESHDQRRNNVPSTHHTDGKDPPHTPEEDAVLPPVNKMFDQLTLAHISKTQLVKEIKGIYSGVVLVENKCINVHKNPNGLIGLTNEQWQSLMSLHHSLLLEHHDFLLATHHPSGSSALQGLPQKYNMPARMWHHGIYNLLELMRKNLPQTQDFMVAWLSICYGLLSLLYEIVIPLRHVWTECLGDLARFQMAIETTCHDLRESWRVQARSWYQKSLEKEFNCGRLYHHLGVLSPGNPIPRLQYYMKAVSTPDPFLQTREYINVLLDPAADAMLQGNPSVNYRFTHLHGLMFRQIHPPQKTVPPLQTTSTPRPAVSPPTKSSGFAVPPTKASESAINLSVPPQNPRPTSNLIVAPKSAAPRTFSYAESDIEPVLSKLLIDLPGDVIKNPLSWLEASAPLAATNITALYEYSPTGKLLYNSDGNNTVFTAAVKLFCQVLHIMSSIFLGHNGEKDATGHIVIPYLHVTFVFLEHLSRHGPNATLKDSLPWDKLVDVLNCIRIANEPLPETFYLPLAPVPEHELPTTLPTLESPMKEIVEYRKTRDAQAVLNHGKHASIETWLPEDALLRGYTWTNSYLPETWYEHSMEQTSMEMEKPSFTRIRKRRILFCAKKLVENGVLGFDTKEGFKKVPLN